MSFHSVSNIVREYSFLDWRIILRDADKVALQYLNVLFIIPHFGEILRLSASPWVEWIEQILSHFLDWDPCHL